MFDTALIPQFLGDILPESMTMNRTRQLTVGLETCQTGLGNLRDLIQGNWPYSISTPR